MDSSPDGSLPAEHATDAPDALRLLMLGDVVGTPGILAVEQQLPRLREQLQPTWVVINGENAVHGSGLSPSLYRRLCKAGADGVTLGDHVYKRVQIASILEAQPDIVRPANLPRAAAGRRWMTLRDPAGSGAELVVFTLLGRVNIGLAADDPFACADAMLAEPEVGERRRDRFIVCEIHAEATAEKQAVGYWLDGRVSAVLGTHTHVATADARLLPRRTAFQTDIGMTGPRESIIGRAPGPVLYHMTTGMPKPFDVATDDPRLSGVLIDLDPATGSATAIRPIDHPADPHQPPFR